jgi:hypothetical protein
MTNIFDEGIDRRGLFRIAGAAGLAGTTLLLPTGASANTAGNLIIKNSSKYILSFTVVSDDFWNCCDSPLVGFIVTGVMPNSESAPVEYLRKDGHGCNGKQGQFAFYPSIPTGKTPPVPQRFWFDNDAGLEFPSDAPKANYFSQLTKRSDKLYVWEVAPIAGG